MRSPRHTMGSHRKALRRKATYADSSIGNAMPWSATFGLARMCLWRALAAEEKFWHFGARAIRRRGLNAIRRSSTPATRSLTSWAKHVAFFFAHRTRFRLAPLLIAQ